MNAVIWKDLCKPDRKIMGCVESRVYSAFRYFTPRNQWDDFYKNLSTFWLEFYIPTASKEKIKLDPWFGQSMLLKDKNDNSSLLERNLPLFNDFLKNYDLYCQEDSTGREIELKEKYIVNYVDDPDGILVSLIDRGLLLNNGTAGLYHALLIKAIDLDEGRVVYLTTKGEERLSVKTWLNISTGLFVKLGKKQFENTQHEYCCNDSEYIVERIYLEKSLDSIRSFLIYVQSGVDTEPMQENEIEAMILSLVFKIIPYLKMVNITAKEQGLNNANLICQIIDLLEALRMHLLIYKQVNKSGVDEMLLREKNHINVIINKINFEIRERLYQL